MNIFSLDTFQKDKKTQARTGAIHTPHGEIETPAFVPVGTQASVKTLTPDEIAELGTRLFFVNTYHMYLRPGIDIVKKAGGLHTFMGWDGPIITDSGGFQVFSLNRGRDTLMQKSTTDSGNQIVKENQIASEGPVKISGNLSVKISEDGVEFQSHWDGTKHLFTPERSMQYQWDLGSDIHIAFDDCTPYGVTHEKAETSMERTHRWAVRSLDEHNKVKSPSFAKASSFVKTSADKSEGKQKSKQPYQALYGSIQGSVFEDLRIKSAKCITSLDFDGYAIGGMAVGDSKKEMKQVLDWVSPLLPPEKPRHLLGVGEIDDIFELVAAGMDTFDCVQPTRLARVGRVFVGNPTNTTNNTNKPMKEYIIDITKTEFAKDFGPIERGCMCYTCRHFTRAYIHHLFHVRELLAYRLATIHNIHFVNALVADIRTSIQEGTFGDWYASFHSR
jgi:queuine/archaeosine tRNA-ribosyltransferase